jgi:broad specificity phosphatase PhoE
LGRVYLIRHGEVAWNRENAYVGQTDVPLTDVGRAQAERLADHLSTKGISHIYSSDLMRARDTAEIIASRAGLETTTINAQDNGAETTGERRFSGLVRSVRELREINYGEWEGLTEVEIAQRYPGTLEEWRVDAAHICIPGGETFSELRDRALPIFRKIALSHKDENIAIVGHKSVNRTILCCLLGADINRYRSIAQENACLNTIQLRGE